MARRKAATAAGSRFINGNKRCRQRRLRDCTKSKWQSRVRAPAKPFTNCKRCFLSRLPIPPLRKRTRRTRRAKREGGEDDYPPSSRIPGFNLRSGKLHVPNNKLQAPTSKLQTSTNHQ